MHYVEGKPIFESTIMGQTSQKHALAAFYKHRFFIQWLILKKWKKMYNIGMKVHFRQRINDKSERIMIESVSTTTPQLGYLTTLYNPTI